jgi:hypothetical protein
MSSAKFPEFNGHGPSFNEWEPAAVKALAEVNVRKGVGQKETPLQQLEYLRIMAPVHGSAFKSWEQSKTHAIMLEHMTLTNQTDATYQGHASPISAAVQVPDLVQFWLQKARETFHRAPADIMTQYANFKQQRGESVADSQQRFDKITSAMPHRKQEEHQMA